MSGKPWKEDRRIALFWSNTRKATNGCLLWRGCKNPKGYGYVRFRDVTRRTHRVAWEITHGPIPAGRIVMHLCDNPSCVNPAHLALGSWKDNAADASRKGRLWQNKVTHCPHGHPYDKDNTKFKKDGSRDCRQCAIERDRGRRKRQKLVATSDPRARRGRGKEPK